MSREAPPGEKAGPSANRAAQEDKETQGYLPAIGRSINRKVSSARKRPKKKVLRRRPKAQAKRVSLQGDSDSARVLQAIADGFTIYSIADYLGLGPVAVMQIVYRLEANGQIQRKGNRKGWEVI